MASNVIVLIVVDSAGALVENSLENNVYLVDTEKFLGSWEEGKCGLHTICEDGQSIIWRIEAVNPSDEISIEDISGSMVSSKVCMPVKDPIYGIWKGSIEAGGKSGRYQYDINIIINGTKTLTFSPYISVI